MRPYIRTAVVLLAATFVSTSVLAQSKSPVHVGQNVQVSKARPDQAHYEVVIAADPNNSKHMLALSMLVPPQPAHALFDDATYSSFDGGETWQETAYVEHGWQVADPTCAYGPNGDAYFTVLTAENKIGDPSQMWFFRSMDGGKTWLKPLSLPFIDREYLTVDHTSGKYRGRIYLNGTGSVGSIEPPSPGNESRFSDIDMWRSTDGGASFLPPNKLASPLPHHVVEGMGNGAVLSDGTFVAITGQLFELENYFQTRPYKAIGRIVVVSSQNGGQTLGSPVTVSDWYIDFNHKLTSGIVPVIAVDSTGGPFKDRLYAVWPDVRSGRSEIMLSHSTDKGKTWSAPIAVNDDRARENIADGPDDGMPSVQVNSNGVVGVMWYDRRDNPDNLGFWPRFAVSMDGGETFLPSVRLSPAPMSIGDSNKLTLYTGAGSSGGGTRIESSRGGNLRFYAGIGSMWFTAGHTNGIAATSDGAFHPLWIDNRTGVPQVWTAPVTVDGKAEANGSADLAAYTDISGKVMLQFSNAQFDRANHTVSVDAYLVNTSDQNISAPVKARIISVKSKMGSVAVANAENGETGAGAVFDFAPELDGGVLKPNAMSKPKKLVFRISDVPAGAERQYESWLQMLQVEAKVLSVSGEKK